MSERTATTTGSVGLRIAEFDRITRDMGLINDAERAKKIGVSHTTISRIRSGEIRPGGRFIAGALEALDVKFEQIFERTAG